MYSRVYVEITNICNKSCSFCPSHSRKSGRMSEAEFEAVTDKLKGHTQYLYYHLMGEPTTHPLLPRFIEIANGKGYKSAVTTNGTLLPRVGDALIKSGVYKVNVSVHSFETGSDEEYLRYINGCLDFADKASRAGVLVILRLWNSGYDGGRNVDIERITRERFADCEWKIGARGARIRHRLHLEYGERFDWPDIEARDGGADVFCYGLKDHFSVLCDGTVVPCCLDNNGTLALGNIFEDNTVEQILSSPRTLAIKQGFDKREASEELCRKCGYARRFK
ncbi:MAG: radical SAM protein [Ruminococcaceae bacterium]|nr:radical SAM protein [Oscillospiraceae bacterium]